MLRKWIAFNLFFLSLFFSVGCTHIIEQRVITQYGKSIETENISKLQNKSSDELREKALANPDALKELKYLKLPTGKVKILNVEKVSDDEKKVVVEVGKKKTKLQYILVKNNKNRWVVDNIIFKKELKGLTSSRSLIDQMTFLLTVREAVDVWETGKRNSILELCTPELKQELDNLPPAYLAKLSKDLFGEPEKKKRHPKGQLDEDIAIVQVSRKNGIVVMTMKLDNEEWRIEDIALQTRKEADQIPSLKKNAIVVNNVYQFLAAYRTENREELKKITASSFYRGSLKFADLTAYPLPDLDSEDHHFEVVIKNKTADLIIHGPTELTKIRLKMDSNQSDIKTKTKYEVEEVVLYELDNNKEEKRLSGMFTAQGVMKVFHEAWINQNLPMLRKTSTKDFSSRVWDQMDKQILPSLQLPEIPAAPPEVLNVSFQGPIIEITANHGDRTVSYILRDKAGIVHVDDILLPVDNRPNSFKETLSLLKPIHQFALGVQTNKISIIRNTVTKNFDGSVWSQLSQVPSICNSIPLILQSPILSVSTEKGRKVVKLGFEEEEVRITLENYHGRYFIDTIDFKDFQNENSQTVNLKIKLKELLASGQIKLQKTSKVVPAEFLIEEIMPEEITPKKNEIKKEVAIPVKTKADGDTSLPEPSDDAFTAPTE